MFLANYGDTPDRRAARPSSSSDFQAVGRVAAFLSRRPTSYPFHIVRVGRRTAASTGIERRPTIADLWINGGYFMFRPEIFDYIEPGEELVEEPFRRLIAEGQLLRRTATTGSGRRWTRSRTCSTSRRMAESGRPPWALWLDAGRGRRDADPPSLRTRGCRPTGRCGCSRSGPTPTTSRSAPAGLLPGWSPRRPRRLGRLARRSRRRAERAEEAHRSAAAPARGRGLAVRHPPAVRDGYLPFGGEARQGGARGHADGLARTSSWRPARDDAHQDHRLLARARVAGVPRTPRSSSTRSRSGTATSAGRTLYVPLDDGRGRRKVGAPPAPRSRRQRDAHWFTPETFRALLRLRGIEARRAERLRRGVRSAARSRRSEETPAMRILVTGHLGYIGTVLTPMLLDARARGRRPRHAISTRGCTFGDRRRRARRRRRSTARPPRRRARRRSTGFDAVVHLAALSNDPLGDLDPSLTYDINHRASVRLARARPGRRRRALRVLVVVQQLRRAGGDDLLDETVGARPGDAYGESKVRVGARRRAARRRPASPRSFLRNATAYGVSPRLRFDLVAQQPRRVGVHHRPGAAQERRHAVAAARPHRGHLAGVPAPCSTRRGTLVHGAAFNVGVDGRELPDPRPRARSSARRRARLRGRRSPTAPRPTRATTGSTATDIARTLGFETDLGRARGAEQLYAAYQAVGLTLDEFEGPRFQRIAHIRELLAEGRLDASLRRLD